MTNVTLRKPGKLESIGIMIMLFSLFGLYQSSNLYLSMGNAWRPHLWASFDFSGAIAFWIFFTLFHISMMFVAARSVVVKNKDGTWNGYDFTVSFLMVLGLYFIAISTVYGVFKGEPNIEFLFNFPYYILMNIGFAIEASGMIWFGVTD